MIRKRGNRYEVRVYDPTTRKQVYVGTRSVRGSINGDPDVEARALEHRAKLEVSGVRTRRRTIAAWAAEWLETRHGAGTTRPEYTTYQQNKGALQGFLNDYGHRPLRSFRRDEAHDFAHKSPWRARTVRAMFNDAMRRDLVDYNPFDKAQIRESEGRKNIVPVTEAEVERMGEIALDEWKGYGPMCAAWITFAAWVGARPREMFGIRWQHVSLSDQTIYIPPELAKKDHGKPRSRTIVLPRRAADALVAMNTLRRSDELVFSNISGHRVTKGGYRYYWHPVRTRFAAELEPNRKARLLADRADIDLYELRHFCGSLLADRGRSAREIAHQLGNSPQVCEDTYIHLFQDRVEDRLRASFDDNVRPMRWQRDGKEARDAG